MLEELRDDIAGLLVRAGFSSETIRRELKRATTEDLPEIDLPDETP